MNALFAAFERASLFGLAALLVALAAQIALDGRVPASWRVWAWRVALLQTALALVPLAPIYLAVLPPRSSMVVPSPPLVAASAHDSSTAKELSESSTRAVPIAEPLAVPTSATQAARPFLAWPPLTALYALSLGFQLLVLARCFGRGRRLLRACNAVDDAAVNLQLREVARSMQVSSHPRLLQSESGAPCLIGILRPAIVLPPALLTPQNKDLEAVLSHELAHLKRRDLAWNTLLWGVQSLFWFHPLVWISRHFLVLETESACDEMVLSSTRVSPKSYGALLLNTMKPPQTPLTVGIADGFFALKTRLLRLNQTPKHPRRAAKFAFALVLCLAFGALVPLRLVARVQGGLVALKTPPATKTSGKTPDPTQAVISKIGIVGGRVLTASGEPVTSARVSWVGYGSNGEMSVGEVLGSTQTDTRGHFRFANTSQLLVRSLRFSGPLMDGIPPQLLVEASGWGAGSAPVLSLASARTTVRLAPSTALEATFLDGEGQVVPGLRVRVSSLSWGRPGGSFSAWKYLKTPQGVKRFEARTDSQGVCRFDGLPQGAEASLAVDDERFAQLTDEANTKLGGGSITVAPPIQLATGASARGRITYRDSGLPVAGVSVGAQGVDPYSTWGEALSDSNGYYEIKSLGAGSYNIAPALRIPLSDDWTARAHEKVVVAAGERAKGLDFQLEPGALITGRVTAEGSTQPVVGLHIGIYGPAHPHSGAWVQMAATASDGTYRLRVPAGQQLIYIMSEPPAGFGKSQSAPTASVPIARSGAYGNATYEITLSDAQSATIDWQLPKVKTPTQPQAASPEKQGEA